jgi:hypothetical protein
LKKHSSKQIDNKSAAYQRSRSASKEIKREDEVTPDRRKSFIQKASQYLNLFNTGKGASAKE